MQRNRAWGFLEGFNAEKQSLGIPGGLYSRETELGDSWRALLQRNRAWGFLEGFTAEKQSLGIPGGL